MKKEQRKEFEKQVIKSIELLLSKHNAKAAEKVHRYIKEASKMVVKKFARAVKHQESKGAKSGSVKKAATAAVKTPAKKRAAVKKVTS